MLRQLDEETKEMLSNCNCKSVQKCFLILGNDKTKYLISQGHPDLLPLSELLEVANTTISLKSKLGLMCLVAKEMQTLLKAGKGYHHGHLHPDNLLTNKSCTKVRITDLGLGNLKKYVSLLTKYTNKSAYTCPEKLTAKGHVVENPDQSTDVYSFGMILW